MVFLTVLTVLINIDSNLPFSNIARSPRRLDRIASFMYIQLNQLQSSYDSIHQGHVIHRQVVIIFIFQIYNLWSTLPTQIFVKW